MKESHEAFLKALRAGDYKEYAEILDERKPSVLPESLIKMELRTDEEFRKQVIEAAEVGIKAVEARQETVQYKYGVTITPADNIEHLNLIKTEMIAFGNADKEKNPTPKQEIIQKANASLTAPKERKQTIQFKPEIEVNFIPSDNKKTGLNKEDPQMPSVQDKLVTHDGSKRTEKEETERNTRLETLSAQTKPTPLHEPNPDAQPGKSALKSEAKKSEYGGVMQPEELKAALGLRTVDPKQLEGQGAKENTSAKPTIEELLAKAAESQKANLRGHRRQQSSGKIELDSQHTAPTRPDPAAVSAKGLQELTESDTRSKPVPSESIEAQIARRLTEAGPKMEAKMKFAAKSKPEAGMGKKPVLGSATAALAQAGSNSTGKGGRGE